MKLLYTCADRADDPLHWSGTVVNCRRALEAAGVEIAVFDRIPFECPPVLRVRHQLHKHLALKTHHLDLEPDVLRSAAQRIAIRFAEGDCDAVFCPGTGVPVHAYLPPEIPTFTYLDATKRSWIEAYFGLRTLCARSRRHVDAVDRRGLHDHTLTFFSSEWAQREAERDYNVPFERMAVVPFGANLTHAPTHVEVAASILARGHLPFRLLFVGKEWERKGGPDALALVRVLRDRGQAATLDIVGCTPVLTEEERGFVCVHGFIDHSTPEGAARFHALLSASHVLVFLSHAEAYGIALCEAAAFGVPAYALRVGGIPTIVRHGETGWLGDAPFCVTTAAHTLIEVCRSPVAYGRVALAARADYEKRLNWQAAGRNLRTRMETALAT
ncbi:MAG: glycosyltransferase family 4 protein [Opitutaceae bacterium]|nr:glycosyltransferase family 4 protein [Opitutaceae bacterium]